MIISIVGVDPGPATGIAVLRWRAGDQDTRPVITWNGYQCDAASAGDLLRTLLLARDGAWTAGEIEHFVHGNLPNSPATVKLEDVLAEVAEGCGLKLARRPMAAVKPWASDKRMAAARAWDAIPAKMVDARAAAKHALMCAVHDGGVTDPLSRGGRPG